MDFFLVMVGIMGLVIIPSFGESSLLCLRKQGARSEDWAENVGAGSFIFVDRSFSSTELNNEYGATFVEPQNPEPQCPNHKTPVLET